MRRRRPSLSLLLAVAVLAGAAAGAGAQKVAPPAADTSKAGEPTTGGIQLQELGECTGKDGLSSSIDKCEAVASLTKPGESHWYKFVVSEDDSAFTLHLLARVMDGRVRMGLWLPGADLREPPSVTAALLTSSTFAQEQYLTLPATELFHAPGEYVLQIVSEYGAPTYLLTADVTSGTTLLADEDRAALKTVVGDCCPAEAENGLVCTLLSRGLTAESMEADLCHQGAVQCDKDGHVTDLVLQGTNTDTDLRCPAFSAGFAQLPKLQRLDLAGARLNAELATIGKALRPASPRLKWLVLRTAGLLGGLSCEIVLPGLEVLSLTRNGLTGPIPECFLQTADLAQLYLTENALTGPLPDFSADSALRLLFARDQLDRTSGARTLTGGLPPSVTAATNLTYLQLSRNALGGELPTLPPLLRYLNVSENGFEGELPGLPFQLVSLDVSGNRLTGSLPGDMTAYLDLVDMQVFNNDLEGPLPTPLPPKLIQLAAARNRLSGPLPTPLPAPLRYLSVAENGLDGPLPGGDVAAGLWIADFSSNMFTGPIPEAFSHALELAYLNVSNNRLTGFERTDDGWFTPSLMTLDAAHNRLVGSVPAALGAQLRLAYLSLAHNELTGTLDGFAARLQPDGGVGAFFDVSDNRLTGTLPERLSYLAAFSAAPAADYPAWEEAERLGAPAKVFDVAGNRLAGAFPAFLVSNLTGLASLHCSVVTDTCDVWVGLDGGENNFTCPPAGSFKTHPGFLPEDFGLLAKQQVGCVGQSGAVYEIASVLSGKPALLNPAAKPPQPYVDAAAAAQAAARAEAIASGGASLGAPAARRWPRWVAGLSPGAVAGVVAGCVAALVLVAVLGYVVVYRRWWTVRAATAFKRMHEGPLAAAGGATINSSAPAAALPSLGVQLPPSTAPGGGGGAAPLGGDDRV